MITIYKGDCREVLANLPDQSVDCCVTSPPYFGLRDYGRKAQIGLEPTPEEFVETLVEVFREVRRVLRDDGTVWLNLGDSYSGSGKGPAGNLGAKNNERHLEHKHSKVVPDGLKAKDLIGIPWRVAFALQGDGWYLRQDIIWSKPNVMPESVKDRCTKAHEYIFLLSKSPRYYFDNDAIKEFAEDRKFSETTTYGGKKYGQNKDKAHQTKSGNVYFPNEKRNKRSVWTVAPKPFSEAHFAVYPPKLIEPCILAGCPEGGTVLDPFGGSGTTGMVADRLNRNSILVELNDDYVQIAKNRIETDGGMFVDLEVK
jgi:DNA modification methylase